MRRFLRLIFFLATMAATAGAGDDASADPVPGVRVPDRVRFLQLEQVTRFNYMDRGPGVVTDRGVQYRVRARVQVDLSRRTNTYLRMRAETGRGFANSWDNAGIGLGEPRWNFNVKSMALGQRAGSHAEFQAGGIEFEQGAGSQHSYASGDGYMTGYRVLLKRAGASWPVDRMSVTAGHIGDFEEPSVFSRLRPGRVDYWQALVEKKLGERVEASAEVDRMQRVWLTRQALRWSSSSGTVLDEVSVEAVTRTTNNPTFGWMASVSRPVDRGRQLRTYALYSHIPSGLYERGGRPMLLNRGEIDVGKRIAWGVTYGGRGIGPEIGIFAGRLLDGTPSKRWVVQIYAGYDYTRIINRLIH